MLRRMTMYYRLNVGCITQGFACIVPRMSLQLHKSNFVPFANTGLRIVHPPHHNWHYNCIMQFRANCYPVDNRFVLPRWGKKDFACRWYYRVSVVSLSSSAYRRRGGLSPYGSPPVPPQSVACTISKVISAKIKKRMTGDT
jgi:hypothetical protein